MNKLKLLFLPAIIAIGINSCSVVYFQPTKVIQNDNLLSHTIIKEKKKIIKV